jgi:hypothetical protein
MPEDVLVGPNQYLYSGGSKPSMYHANKSASRELLGANFLFCALLQTGGWQELSTPLNALIDYRGFRLLCAALLPINKGIFDNDAQIFMFCHQFTNTN